MDLAEIKSIPEFDDLDIDKFSNSFVPYLYLDGHRSSNVGNSDIERYQSGYRFFQRFVTVMKELGFKNMVTMVHTYRNCNVKGRVDSIHSAIQKNSLNLSKNSSFRLYGDIDAYKEMGKDDFYNFIKNIECNSNGNCSFTNHILINYSENWALNNLEKIDSIPPISTVIRFTKGFVSGGWIPMKMQETTFIYSQIPSIAEFWSDEAIALLILIALKNWSQMSGFIGKKEYKTGEKELIHNNRDVELKLCKHKMNIPGFMQNRIVAFGVDGPVLYEI